MIRFGKTILNIGQTVNEVTLDPRSLTDGIEKASKVLESGEFSAVATFDVRDPSYFFDHEKCAALPRINTEPFFGMPAGTVRILPNSEQDEPDTIKMEYRPDGWKDGGLR